MRGKDRRERDKKETKRNASEIKSIYIYIYTHKARVEQRPHLKFGFCPTSAPSGGSGFGTIRAVDIIVFWSFFLFLLEKMLLTKI